MLFKNILAVLATRFVHVHADTTTAGCQDSEDILEEHLEFVLG